MHFFQVVVAWMFPCAVCATMAPTVAAAAATEGASTVEQGSSSSPAFGPGDAKVASDPGSSPSSRSSTSSSPNSPRSPAREAGDAAAPKGYAVRRCLCRFAKKLQRAGAENAADERPGGRRGRESRATKMDGRVAAVEDGTAREREEAVASAIAYCKETSRPRCKPPLAPSPSLDGWLLLDPPPEETAGTTSAAASHHAHAACDECVGCTPSTAETRRGPAPELGEGDDVVDGLDGDVLRITSYFAAKYVPCAIED